MGRDPVKLPGGTLPTHTKKVKDSGDLGTSDIMEEFLKYVKPEPIQDAAGQFRIGLRTNSRRGAGRLPSTLGSIRRRALRHGRRKTFVQTIRWRSAWQAVRRREVMKPVTKGAREK